MRFPSTVTMLLLLANLHSCNPDTTNGTCGSNILGRVSLNEQQVSTSTSLNDPSIREAKEFRRDDRCRTQRLHRRQPGLHQQP